MLYPRESVFQARLCLFYLIFLIQAFRQVRRCNSSHVAIHPEIINRKLVAFMVELLRVTQASLRQAYFSQMEIKVILAVDGTQGPAVKNRLLACLIRFLKLAAVKIAIAEIIQQTVPQEMLLFCKPFQDSLNPGQVLGRLRPVFQRAQKKIDRCRFNGKRSRQRPVIQDSKVVGAGAKFTIIFQRLGHVAVFCRQHHVSEVHAGITLNRLQRQTFKRSCKRCDPAIQDEMPAATPFND